MNNENIEHIYRDGRHYDLLQSDFNADIPFWIEQSQRYESSILELACGTGRITIPIAKNGMEITGLDLSKNMLTEARKKALLAKVDIEWVHADCRDFDLGRQFRLIIFPFNSMCHLHVLSDIESCLSCVRKHLKPEGRFIIDIFNPNLDFLTRDSSKRFPLAAYEDPDGRGTVEITESNIYDDASQVNRIKMHYKIGNLEEIAEELNMRIFYPQEIDALLKYNGFIIENKFGDFSEIPYKSGSPKQIIVCRK